MQLLTLVNLITDTARTLMLTLTHKLMLMHTQTMMQGFSISSPLLCKGSLKMMTENTDDSDRAWQSHKLTEALVQIS